MNWFKLFSISVVMTILAACSSDDAATTGGAVIVTAESGAKIELTGTWKSACYTSGGNDVKDVHTYSSSGAFSNGVEIYASADASCTGTVTTNSNLDTQLAAGADKTMLGWVDGTGTGTTAPNSAAGPALSSTPVVSKLLHNWEVDLKGALLLDDSVAGSLVYYRSKESAGLDADGYPDYITTADPMYKQP